jgi:hypothetical protein
VQYAYVSGTIDRLRTELNRIGLQNRFYFIKKSHSDAEILDHKRRIDRVREIKNELAESYYPENRIDGSGSLSVVACLKQGGSTIRVGCGVIDIRRLAAVDIAFLGSRFILAEFLVGVFGPLSLAVLTFFRTHSLRGAVFGAYLLCIGINYVPLLVHSIDLVRQGTAKQEIADELPEKRRMFRKYRRQSLLLLVPLVVPVLALVQWRSSKQENDR